MILRILLTVSVAMFALATASALAARQEGQIGPTKYYQDGKRIPPPANPPPVYPQNELRRRIGGTTVVSFALDAHGKISGAQVKTTRGNKNLDKAAVAAARPGQPRGRCVRGVCAQPKGGADAAGDPGASVKRGAVVDGIASLNFD